MAAGKYLVGLVLRALMSIFVYLLITDDRLFQLPLNRFTIHFKPTKLAFVNKIYITVVHEFTQRVTLLFIREQF